MYNKVTQMLIYIYIALWMIFWIVGCTQDYNSWFAVGVTADTEDPVIHLTSPQNADCVPSLFDISGFITDDRDPDRIEISYRDLSGDTFTQTEATTRDFSLTFDLSHANIVSGDLAFQLTAYDKAGHKSSADLSVTVDKSSPVITLFEPDDGGTGIVSQPIIGAVSFNGMVNDDYSLNLLSSVNAMKIYKASDDQQPIITQPLNSTPFIIKNVMNTMDESHIVGEYIAEFTFADVNGNIGSKRIRFTTAKGDKTTTVTIDAPQANYQAADSLTLSGSAVNNFLDIISVQYVISDRSSNQPIAGTEAVTLELGPAGTFSDIISLKKLEIEAGQYNLRVTAFASDGSSGEASVPFSFRKDYVDYEFIDTSDSSWLEGRTPNASSYINGDFYVEIASLTDNVSDADYRITAGGVTYRDWTSMLANSQTRSDDHNTYTVYSQNVKVSELDYTLPDGVFNIQTRVRQTVGQSIGDWRTLTRAVNIDRTPPSLEISSPAVTTGINGELTVSGSASDNLGLLKLQVREDDSEDKTFRDADGSLSLWSYTSAKDDEISDTSIEDKYGVSAGQTKDISFTIAATDLAGNVTSRVLSVTIDYDADMPVLTFLMPETDNQKYSGTLTMNATIADDDYPRKGMSAAMNVYKYKDGFDAAGDYQNEIAVESKTFTEEMIADNSNLSYSINLDNEVYEDLAKYVIVLTGHGWKDHDAVPVMRTFIVDKGVPYIDVSSDTEYVTNQIHFSGYVRYKAGSELDANNPFIMQYTNNAGKNVTAAVTLDSVTDLQIENVHYCKQTFDIVLNADGSHTGFVSGSEPTVTWSDDQWGNSTKLWTFRATSATALQGWKTCRTYLDNHKPTVTITSPADGYLFDDTSSQSFNLKFVVNDEPPAGSSYTLNFRDNVQISYLPSGESEWIVKSDYGEGDSTALQGENVYNISFTGIDDALGNKVKLVAKDRAGNVSDEAVLIFHKSTTPPSITSFEIDSARADSLYCGNITINIDAQDKHSKVDDGLSLLELLMDGSVIDTVDLSASSYPTEHHYSKEFDTTAWSDGTHIFTCRVTDKSDITVYNESTVANIGITVDNTAPSLSSSQLLAMGENASDIIAIDKWTAYIGYRFAVSDNISLFNQNPTIKIGTTDGGNDILTDTTLQTSMSSISAYQSEFTNWIYMFDILGAAYDTTDKIYVTLTFSDAAGNETQQKKTYDKGELPIAAFNKTAEYAYSGANDVVVDGTYSGSVGKAWLRVGAGDWHEVTLSDGSWTVTLDKGLFASSGEYTMSLRVMSEDKSAQNVISCKYLVDIEAPTVNITDISAYSDSTGHVSGSSLSGKVVISGTYNDDLADKIESASYAELTMTIGSKSQTITGITRNYGGTPWDWQMIWDTEDTSSFLSSVVQSSVTINVSCKDYAGNAGSTSMSGISVVPYITHVTGASSSDNVYPVRYYSDGEWGNHSDELRYSLAAGTAVKVCGYNLKQGSTKPTVKRGSTAVTVSASDVHSVTFTAASGWQSDAITITVSSISALNGLYLNIWNFTSLTRSSYADDTLYALGYDMVLLDDTVTVGGKTSNKVFATFARNTKITDYTDYDYCAFSFYEGKTSAATRYTFNGNNKIVDPLFYAAVAKISNNSFESMYTYDEWGVDATRIATITKDSTVNTQSWYASGPSNRADCVKSTRLIYNGSRIYAASYDDESRQDSPSPKVWFGQAAASSSITMESVGNCNGYFDLAAAYSTKYPVLVYGDDSGLRTAYVNAVDNSTLIGKSTVITDGSMYCKIVPANAAATMHLVYQDASNNLSYRRVSGSKYTTVSDKVLLECANTEIDGVKEGVTGYNTNIDIHTSAKTKGSVTYAKGSPHISYINNSVLNTVTALRYARCSSASSTSAADWEYMIVPSPVSVGKGETFVRTDVSNNPVIMYKGDDRLYIARLAD